MSHIRDSVSHGTCDPKQVKRTDGSDLFAGTVERIALTEREPVLVDDVHAHSRTPFWMLMP